VSRGSDGPSVLVTILAYRSIATIGACVRAAQSLRHAGPLVIAVREQGGDPDERELLRALAQADERVTVSSGPNLGFAGGQNILLNAHVADIVLVLNADALVDPDLLERALPAFADPSVGAVQPRVRRPGGGSILDTTGLMVLRSRRVLSRNAGVVAGRWAPGGAVFFAADGCVALYRWRALEEAADMVGGGVFWERLFAYKEDVELAWRLQWLGWRTRYEPLAGAVHIRGALDDAGAHGLALLAVRRAMPAVATTRGFANQRLVQLVHEDPARLVRDLLPFLRREALAWLVLLVVGPRRWEALRLLLAGLPAATRRRRAVFAGRQPGADPYVWLEAAPR
jgi:GT2 family glycosyltransferase